VLNATGLKIYTGALSASPSWFLYAGFSEVLSGTASFRALTVVDIFTKECLAIEVGQSLKGEHVDRGQLWGQQIVAESPGSHILSP
jgi:hypothetical protein